jgi:hypothetical protein
MGNAMGVNTWAAFAGTDDRAVVDGDFMLESELRTALAGARGGINVVAIHQHMTHEHANALPPLWGVGRTEIWRARSLPP